MKLQHLGISIAEGAYFRNPPVVHAEDSNSHDGKLAAAELRAYEAAQIRATTRKATNDFVAFSNIVFDHIVQVRKGFADHEKKSLQAIHAIERNERTAVNYVLMTNLIHYAEVALIDELLEVASRQRFVHIQ